MDNLNSIKPAVKVAINQTPLDEAVQFAKNIAAALPGNEWYWQLGQKISKALEQKGVKKKETLQTISSKSGLGMDSLRKSLKFYKDYKEEGLQELKKAPFTIPWRVLANNLRIPSEVFTDICINSKTPTDLTNAVSAWRDANPTAQGQAAQARRDYKTLHENLSGRVSSAKTGLEGLLSQLSELTDGEDTKVQNILGQLSEILSELG